MTFEEARAYLKSEEVAGQYLKDGMKIIPGLSVIDKYQPLNDFYGAEHEILYVASVNPFMRKEEILQLYRWGFHLDTDGECWAIHC